MEGSTLFKRLNAVREGHYISLAIGPATSIAFPSLLSVRYATTTLIPRMADAINGNGSTSAR